MKSKQAGIDTSEVEVTHISAHGIWVYVRGSEHFLPYADFPWFRNARIQEVLHVELNHGSHLNSGCLPPRTAHHRFALHVRDQADLRNNMQ